MCFAPNTMILLQLRPSSLVSSLGGLFVLAMLVLAVCLSLVLSSLSLLPPSLHAASVHASSSLPATQPTTLLPSSRSLPAADFVPGQCHREGTQSAAGARFTGLPSCLETGTLYTALLEGNRHCPGGGDYWELLLMGPLYLARAPSTENANGSHTVSVLLPHLSDASLPGSGYTLYAHLLFEGGAGFGGPGSNWKEEKMLGLEDGISLQLTFVAPGQCSPGAAAPPPAPDTPCSTLLHPAAPHPPTPWTGFWLRSATASLHQPCAPPLCAAAASTPNAAIAQAMPDNAQGWVYRLPHCAFRLLPQGTARACLAGAHLLALGDSTMQDSVRNLLTDGLAVPGELFMADAQFLPRSANFTGVSFPAASAGAGTGASALPPLPGFSLTLQYTGSPDVKAGGQGVRTYADRAWAAALAARTAALPPTAAWVNEAGLHTAQWSGDVGVGALAEVRAALQAHVLPLWLGSGARTLVYRSNVCPALEHRSHRGNPQSMQAHNALVVEELWRAVAAGGGGGQPAVHVVDFFDMTFPWHLHPCCSDGAHFGRPPYYQFWRNGAVYTGGNNLGEGAGFSMVSVQHYVDNMVHQIFLGAVCDQQA